jgi:cytochrome c oxidase subunit II
VTWTKRLVALGFMCASAVYSTPNVTRAEEPRTIKIAASKFHFTPDHITLVKGQPVTLQLTSTDTTHGFLIRALKIDTDIKPGIVTKKTVIPATAGTFKAICDHYCGIGHGGMKMTVQVVEATAKTGAEKVASGSGTLSK